MSAYEARGSVRGSCGHRHRTIAAAQACADRDQRGVRRCYPGTFPTFAYSDRYVVRLDGEPLSGAEERELVVACQDHDAW